MSRKRHTEVSWDSDDDLLRDDTSAISAFPKNEIRADSDDELDEELLLGSDDDLDEVAPKKSSGKKTSSASNKSSSKVSSKSVPTKIQKTVISKSSVKSVSDTSVQNDKQKQSSKSSKSSTAVSSPVTEKKKPFKFTRIVPPSPDTEKEKPSKTKTTSKSQSVEKSVDHEEDTPARGSKSARQPASKESRSQREQPQKHTATKEPASKHETSTKTIKKDPVPESSTKTIKKEPIPVVEFTDRSDFEDEEEEEIVLDIEDPAADAELFDETDPLLQSSQNEMETDAVEEEDEEEEVEEVEEEEEDEEEEAEEEDEDQDMAEEDTTLENSKIEAAEEEQETEESESESDDSESGRGRFKSERAKIVTTTTVKAKPRDIDAIPETLEISEEQQAQIDEFLVAGGKRGRGRGRGRGVGGRGGNMSQSGRFPPYQGQGQNYGQHQPQQYQGNLYNMPPNFQNQGQGHMPPNMGPGYMNQGHMHPGHMGQNPNQPHSSHAPSSQSQPFGSSSSQAPSKLSMDVSESLQGHTRPVPLTSKSAVPSLFTLAGLDKPKTTQQQQQPRKILINPHFRGPQPQQDRPPSSAGTGMPLSGPQMPGPYQGPTSQPQPHQPPQDRAWPPHSQPSGPPYPIRDAPPPTSRPMGGFPQPAQGFPDKTNNSLRNESADSTSVEDDGGPRPQQGFPQGSGPPNMFPSSSGPRGAQPAPNNPQMGMPPPGHPQYRHQGPMPGLLDNRFGAPPQQRFPAPGGMNQFNNPPRQPVHGAPSLLGNPRANQFPPHMNQRPPHQGGPREQFHPNQMGNPGNQGNRGNHGNQQHFQPPMAPHQMMRMPNSGQQHQHRQPMQHPPRQQHNPRQQQPRQQQPRQQHPPHLLNQNHQNRQNQFQPRPQFSGNKQNFNRRLSEENQQIQSIQVISRGKRQSTDKDKVDHSPAKVAKAEEIVDPVLKAKLEEQKRKRDHVIKIKEARRLALAGERRSQLAKKLAEEGKTIADVEKGVVSTAAKNNVQRQNSAGQGQNQGQNFQQRAPNMGQPRFGPRQSQQLGGPQGPRQTGPRQQFSGPRPAGPRAVQQAQGPRPTGPGNNIHPNTVVRQNSQPGNQNRQVNMPSSQANANQNANPGKDSGKMVLKQKVTILKKDVHGKVISRTVVLKNLNKPANTDGRQVTIPSGHAQRTVVNKSAGASQRKVVQNQEGRRVVVGESPPLSAIVSIDNLSVSTTEATIRKMCFDIGEVENIQVMKGQKKATVTFSEVNSAANFTKKFNRHMLDLSHINVTHLPV